MPSPVSIAILTRNGIATLPGVLAAIDAQQYDAAVEIVVVDSASTDGTAELVRRRAHRVVLISAKDFNHGDTRNLALEATSHAYVVLLVQDAVPIGPSWLSSLIAPLESDRTIAATWARQVPHADASPVTRAIVHRWLGSATTPRIAAIDGAREFESMTPWERTNRCTLDNVCSCVRRAVWEQHRFPRVSIGEDVEWARDVLLAGHRIAFVPEAVVRHSHERSAAYEFRRTMLIHNRLRVLFGLRTVPRVRSLARAVGSSLRDHGAWVMADASARLRPAAWWRAVSLAVAWPLGQYLGSRVADRGVRLRGFKGI